MCGSIHTLASLRGCGVGSGAHHGLKVPGPSRAGLDEGRQEGVAAKQLAVTKHFIADVDLWRRWQVAVIAQPAGSEFALAHLPATSVLLLSPRTSKCLVLEQMFVLYHRDGIVAAPAPSPNARRRDSRSSRDRRFGPVTVADQRWRQQRSQRSQLLAFSVQQRSAWIRPSVQPAFRRQRSAAFSQRSAFSSVQAAFTQCDFEPGHTRLRHAAA